MIPQTQCAQHHSSRCSFSWSHRGAQCYCPYTHCPSGVAIMTADGGAFAGGYVESAAYNPGLPPFQAAIVAAVVGGMPSYDQVCFCCSG